MARETTTKGVPHQADRQTQALAEADSAQLRDRRKHPLFSGDGKDLGVSLDIGGSKTITHGLDRKPRGWLFHSLEVASGSTNVHPWVRKGSVTTTSLVVETACDATSTCRLYVF